MTYFDGFVVAARRRGLGDRFTNRVYTFVRAVGGQKSQTARKTNCNPLLLTFVTRR